MSDFITSLIADLLPRMHDDAIMWMIKILMIGVFLFMVLVVGAGIVLLIQWIIYTETYVNPRHEKGFVKQVHFSVGKTSTGVGNAIGANGQNSVVVTTHTDPDSYMVVITGTHEIKRADIDDEDLYDDLQAGDQVELTIADAYSHPKWRKMNLEDSKEVVVSNVRFKGKIYDVHCKNLRLF